MPLIFSISSPTITRWLFPPIIFRRVFPQNIILYIFIQCFVSFFCILFCFFVCCLKLVAGTKQFWQVNVRRIFIITMSRWPFLATHLYHSRLVFQAKSCIGTELLYIGSSWLSCLCLSMWRSPQKYIAYEFVLTSPAVSHMSGSSNFDSFHDGW